MRRRANERLEIVRGPCGQRSVWANSPGRHRAIAPARDRHAAAPMDALERADAGDAAWFAALDDDALERAMTRATTTDARAFIARAPRARADAT